MNYALYRKWRPKTFGEVVGQEAIVRALLGQVRSGRISHAYLFCGTRGTGKTTLAKIMARAVNCENPHDGEPCNECMTCKATLSGQNMNVIEMDAATHNGVDDVRDIADSVVFPPTMGRYRVYIIDEVHMMTPQAFNAFLKTLEEPPPHVIFLLATTDPQKLLQTVLSRCQRFDLRRVGFRPMIEAISKIFMAEGIEADEAAIDYIASQADGSMRDALTLSDQCIAYFAGERLTVERVESCFGAVSKTALFDLTRAISEENSASCLELIASAIDGGRDVSQFTVDMITHLRNLLVVKASGGLDMNITPEYAQMLKTQANSIEMYKLLTYAEVFAGLQSQMRYTKNARLLFELTCLKLSTAQEEMPMPKKERQVTQQATTKTAPTTSQQPNPSAKAEPRPAPIKPATDISSGWKDFVAKNAKGSLKVLERTEAQTRDGALYIICENPVTATMLNSKAEQLTDMLTKHFGTLPTYHVITRADFDSRFGTRKDAQPDDWDKYFS